jgi:hypothetical protein
MKIKVFKFQVSNAAYGQSGSCESYRWYQNLKDKTVSTEYVERIINEFCSDKEVVDIKINNVDTNYHNNGYSNTIELWYTIMYK